MGDTLLHNPEETHVGDCRVCEGRILEVHVTKWRAPRGPIRIGNKHARSMRYRALESRHCEDCGIQYAFPSQRSRNAKTNEPLVQEVDADLLQLAAEVIEELERKE